MTSRLKQSIEPPCSELLVSFSNGLRLLRNKEGLCGLSLIQVSKAKVLVDDPEKG